MNTYRAPAEIPLSGRKACAAIGFFDGVHRGHQEIIRRTIAEARKTGAASLVITFDPHPAAVVAPERAPLLIYPLGQKVRAIEAEGAEVLLLLPFTKKFSQQSAEQFITWLASGLGRLHSVCVGANFHFGCGREGTTIVLAELGAKLGFAVDTVQVLTEEGSNISSTRIREAIRAGEMDHASSLLGRPYGISGEVLRGNQIGQKIGFPTANLDVRGLVLPPNGVYVAQVNSERFSKPAVLNIGLRPTLETEHPELRVETHIPGLDGELYGEFLEVCVGRKLRDERKFASLDALKEQISKDVEQALALSDAG